ncbi:MAG: hypothetical protein GTO00_09105 [Deltaproteobacteria bacterium]|nr:hypothetical protein [Deltaproteobacteria bacterium]
MGYNGNERRQSYTDFENRILRKAWWIGFAAISTVFLAGGNWAVSQYRINALAADGEKQEIRHEADMKGVVTREVLELKLEPIRQAQETLKDTTKRIEQNVYENRKTSQKILEKLNELDQ